MQNSSPERRQNRLFIFKIFAQLTAIQCLKFFICLELIFKIIQVIYNSSVLAYTRNSTTKIPFKLFIMVHIILCIIQFILFYLKHQEYFRVTRLPDVQENGELSLFGNFVDAFSLFWSLSGLHWTQECKTCKFTSPLLYYTTLFWSYWGILVVISPLVAIVVLIFILAYFKPELPIITYKENCEINKHDSQCPICLLDYNYDERVKILPCKHHFHCLCVDEWFLIDDVCPLCKKPINMLYDFIE